MKTLFSFIFFSSACFMLSCEQEPRPVKAESVPLNSFQMKLNGAAWTPTVIDQCQQTFDCSFSQLDHSPFYQIKAYRDPQARASAESENILDIQIMDVARTGTYVIDGSTKDFFTSYARFVVHSGGETKLYTNKAGSTAFKVIVTGLLPREGSDLVGIQGVFSGKLFNVDDEQDVIEVTNGEFVFEKTNWYNFNQCEE